MTAASARIDEALRVERIHVSGVVQGVGFRPTVWRIAQSLSLTGQVANNGHGVEILACASPAVIDRFCDRLRCEAPPLARIREIRRERVADPPELPMDFRIVESISTEVKTGIAPDAATCAACLAEILDPLSRRFRYPFANCTHCGPRLSIIRRIPYDRGNTTMSAFPMCAECAREFDDPADRRFHAQPICCHACGPRVWLERGDGRAFAIESFTQMDAVDAVCTLLKRGQIVAIKGLGGFQVACDASNEEVVSRLRQSKRRQRKPFALMVRDIALARRYCKIDIAEEALLASAAAPIVLLEPARDARLLAASLAPGVSTLGVMLPNTPLHHLILRRMDRPIVLTSGNLADEPQCIDNDDARRRLGGLCDYLLLHDRQIAQRVDDSVSRVVMGKVRVSRRSRGWAPAPIGLPKGFEAAPPVLALGGELKSTFCLLRDGQAVLSHHIGDLEELNTYNDYRRAIDHYAALFAFTPATIAVDLHPEYLSSKFGQVLAAERRHALVGVQHHHAHVAACMAENGIALDDGPVIGVALDGLGMGSDGGLWGGEFLLADYTHCKRLGTFKPVAMLGGAQAMHEPWRNTYAHIIAEMGWVRFQMNYGETALCRFFEGRNRALLDAMLRQRLNAPLASSCGRLFDAVAAAADVCRERAHYEGEAAIAFEAIADAATLSSTDTTLDYPFAIPRLKDSGLPYIEPLSMWQAVLGDIVLETPASVISARFHRGLANSICTMVEKVSAHETGEQPIRTVALSGGVCQNRTLLEKVALHLQSKGFTVLTHSTIPANDGGIAFGQAVIAAARSLAQSPQQEVLSCA